MELTTDLTKEQIIGRLVKGVDIAFMLLCRHIYRDDSYDDINAAYKHFYAHTMVMEWVGLITWEQCEWLNDAARELVCEWRNRKG